jgi:hypothetical protein
VLWLRRLLFWLAVGNLTAAVFVNQFASFHTALAYALVTSKYHQLDVDGVINHNKLAETRGLQSPQNQRQIVDWLVGPQLTGLYEASFWVSAAFIVNAAILICAWYLVRRDWRLAIPNGTEPPELPKARSEGYS